MLQPEVVLMYHRVVANIKRHSHVEILTTNMIDRGIFFDQVRWMKDKFAFEGVASGNRAMRSPVPAPKLRLTFDDGYVDSIEVVAPMLKQLGVPAVFYLVPGFLGREVRPWWERLFHRCNQWVNGDTTGMAAVRREYGFPRSNVSAASVWRNTRLRLLKLPRYRFENAIEALELEELPGDQSSKLMSWTDAKHLSGMELCSLGFHSYGHASFSSLGAEELNRDVTQGLNSFRTRGVPIEPSFAYPFGIHSHEGSKALWAAGITRAYVANRFPKPTKPYNMSLPRVFVGPEHGPRELMSRIYTSYFASRFLYQRATKH